MSQKPNEQHSNGRHLPTEQKRQHEQNRQDQSHNVEQTRRSYASRQQNSVPTGLRLVSLTMGIVGGLLILGAVFVIGGAQTVASYGIGGIGSSLAVLGIVLAGVGVGNLAGAYGTWRLKSWGWNVGILALGIGAVVAFLSILSAGSGGVVGLLLYGGMGWYLYANEARYRRLVRDGTPTTDLSGSV